jgi:ABC-2 type transport system ATP-binding protein
VKREAQNGDTPVIAADVARDADVGAVTEGIVAAICAAGVGVREVAPRLASLEQVFSELTTGEGEAG